MSEYSALLVSILTFLMTYFIISLVDISLSRNAFSDDSFVKRLLKSIMTFALQLLKIIGNRRSNTGDFIQSISVVSVIFLSILSVFFFVHIDSSWKENIFLLYTITLLLSCMNFLFLTMSYYKVYDTDVFILNVLTSTSLIATMMFGAELFNISNIYLEGFFNMVFLIVSLWIGTRPFLNFKAEIKEIYYRQLYTVWLLGFFYLVVGFFSFKMDTFLFDIKLFDVASVAALGMVMLNYMSRQYSLQKQMKIFNRLTMNNSLFVFGLILVRAFIWKV
ncbi:MAG: hypothetical protein HON90_15520 [Halobacteriovoraceae bacterium]|jgi:hypothetical protein|nr:hypothetical protein [Halobacteriovoraceae bacterium]